MKKTDVLKLENQLCFSVYAASRAITKIYRPFLDEIGVTYPQYLVMLVLWENNVVTLKDLGNKLYLDSGTLTPLLKRLEHMELIKRERSKEDERLLCVTITQKGLDLKKRAAKIPGCVLAGLSTDIAALMNLKNEIDGLLNNVKIQEEKLKN
ncbi:MAG: ohrR [Clostridia bacterium]|jgi:DNA-binding MarR family transcriptional regulator|nr:ohrR [Clostridia bacterium]